MNDLIKEQKELFKNHIIDYLNDEINTTKQQLKQSVENCDKNYFSGALNSIILIKEYIKNM